MRRNYVAVMLGLALTVSSISAFASEGTTEAGTEVTTEAATEAASEASEKEATTTVYGQVTEVTSDSITITKGDLVGGAADTENTEDTTEAAADSEETTEAAADGTEGTTEAVADGTEDTTEAATEASTEADAKESLALELSTEAATYKFAPDAVITELASTEDITAEDAAEAEATTESATEASTEAATEAGTEAVIGEADETTGVEVAEESSEAADDKIEITTDDILAGDIVALEVNADGEVTSLTILAYGTGSYVDTTEAETDLAEEALLGDEASTEAVTEEFPTWFIWVNNTPDLKKHCVTMYYTVLFAAFTRLSFYYASVLFSSMNFPKIANP